MTTLVKTFFVTMTQNIDLRLKCPFTMLISGPSNCGKTTFTLNLLKRCEEILNSKPGRVYWFYKIDQKVVQEGQSYIHQYENKMCTMEWLQENQPPKNSILVIDDMALEATADTAKLFSVGSHHYSVNIVFLCQNLFTKNQYFRDISLNSTYVILFKNVRDKQQVSNFAKQFAPQQNKGFLAIFGEATKSPYSYIILDNHQVTNNSHRIISNYFQENNLPISMWRLNE